MISGEYCKLIQSRYQVPACSDVAGDEDTKGEDGEGVHQTITAAEKVFMSFLDIT